MNLSETRPDIQGEARPSTRDVIIAAADDLFYRRGFEATSFADIAGAVGISRGNFYHHFKTKDAILDAVIARRLADRRAMTALWEEHSDPVERIGCFIDILIGNRDKIMSWGCPVGTLCTELGKLAHPAEGAATGILSLFRDWLALQFAALGRGDARALALHLLARSQGVAVLAQAFRDAGFVTEEVAALKGWVDDIAGGSA